MRMLDLRLCIFHVSDEYNKSSEYGTIAKR